MAVRPQTIAISVLIATIGTATLIGAARARQRHQWRHERSHGTTNLAPTNAAGPAITTAPATSTLALPPDPFDGLAPICFSQRDGKHSLTTRLYARGGKIDEAAATELDVLLADTRDPKEPKTTRIDRRLLQLIFRAAYHFEVYRVQVTSAYRMQSRRREGLHAQGRAIDFAIPGIKAVELASYLRKMPRVGVGVYTHPRTQFVHLDVRPESYHWLDASPPGRTWRGLSIGDKSLAARDAAYRPESDWPEGLPAPAID